MKFSNFILRNFFKYTIQDSQVNQFNYMFIKMKYDYGNYIYQNNQKIEYIYIIKSGVVEINKNNDNNQK